MRTACGLFCLLGLTSSAAAQRTRTVVVVPGQVTRVITDTMGTPYDIPVSAGRAFTASPPIPENFLQIPTVEGKRPLWDRKHPDQKDG